jgi:hypothetical protein
MGLPFLSEHTMNPRGFRVKRKAAGRALVVSHEDTKIPFLAAKPLCNY